MQQDFDFAIELEVSCPVCGRFTHIEESELDVRKCFCGHVFTSSDIEGDASDMVRISLDDIEDDCFDW